MKKNAVRRGAIGGAEADGEGEEVPRVETRTHPTELPHGLQHQAGADQQNERRRYLGNYQHGAEAVLTARGASAAFLKCSVQLEPGYLQSRHKAEDHARGY